MVWKKIFDVKIRILNWNDYITYNNEYKHIIEFELMYIIEFSVGLMPGIQTGSLALISIPPHVHGLFPFEYTVYSRAVALWK